MKRIFYCIFTALLVLSGCSSNEIVTVNWTTIGEEPTDLQLVQDEMNKILVADYGVEIDFTYIDFADYTEQMGLQLASGSPLDIVFAPSWSIDYPTSVNDGLYMSLDEYLTDEFKSTIDQSFWDGVTIDGSIYAVPTDKELGPAVFGLFDQEKIEEQNYDTTKVDSLESALDISAQYYKDTGEKGFNIDKSWATDYPINNFDCVPALDYQVCLDIDNPEAGYKWAFDFESYQKEASLVNSYINDGVVATNPGDYYDWKTEAAFLHTATGLPTSEAGWELANSRTYDVKQLNTPVITTDTVQGSLNVISASSEHPEEAMKVLEAFNTDERLRNLNAFGIEGIHYNLNEGGKVVYTDESANYMPSIYAQGDYDSMYLLADEPDDTRQVLKDFNSSAIVSPALGFSPDLSKYQAQVANILNINNKYSATIMDFMYTGSLEEALKPVKEEYLKVEADKVIEEINKQYDEWKSQQ